MYPLCRRLGGSRGQSGQVQTREILLLSLGFEPQTVQPVASHYTDYAVLAPGYIGLSKKMDGILNRYNLKSTGRIYTFGVLKCSEKFKVLDLP